MEQEAKWWKTAVSGKKYTKQMYEWVERKHLSRISKKNVLKGKQLHRKMQTLLMLFF